MIEIWYQITCNGCGETDTSTFPNEGKLKYLKLLKKRWNWQACKGDIHYCHACVKSGKAKRREDIFSSPHPTVESPTNE
jgi:hypothetical protein